MIPNFVFIINRESQGKIAGCSRLFLRLEWQPMKTPEHLKPQGGQFNLTPMIDVVFLLIIFFIVSNNMIQQDNAVQVDLPEAETGVLPQEQQTKCLTITLEESGTLYVGVEELNKSDLRRLLTECRKDWGEAAAIRIRFNKGVLFGDIKSIMKMAAESGITHVSFSVKEPPLSRFSGGM